MEKMIEIDKAKSVEFALFARFVKFLGALDKIYDNKEYIQEIIKIKDLKKDKPKDNLILCYYAAKELLDGYGMRTVENFFSENNAAVKLPPKRFELFCEKFQQKFDSLQPAQQEYYNAINTAFIEWRNGIYNKKPLDYDKSKLITNQSATLETQQTNDLPPQYKGVNGEESFSPNEFKKSFDNSKWFCYMLIPENGLLGRQTIEFKSFNERNECRIKINHFIPSKIPVFYGKAIFSQGDGTLILTTTSYENETNTNYYRDYASRYFKVDNTLGELELCIGQLTFKYKKFGTIISLMSIITKCKDDEDDFTVKTFNLEVEDKSVPPSIRRFFKQLKMDRLETPREIEIFDFESLDFYLSNPKKRL